MLHHVRALLERDGLLIFSSHRQDFAFSQAGWARVLLGSPRHRLRSALRTPLRVRNRRRLRAREPRAVGYELRNDEAREFGVLHYYISRDGQERHYQSSAMSCSSAWTSRAKAWRARRAPVALAGCSTSPVPSSVVID